MEVLWVILQVGYRRKLNLRHSQPFKVHNPLKEPAVVPDLTNTTVGLHLRIIVIQLHATMLFINFVLLMLKLTVSTEGLSTCHSFDLDDHKSKRIEAVRGQILSKLRIRSPPESETAPSPAPVPPEVMLLYNSTRELLKERARLADACDRESSEEDYYAKEVQRVDMQPPDTSESTVCCAALWTALYCICQCKGRGILLGYVSAITVCYK